ncbi:hypothetical protein QOZ80_1BG0093160 [Eleusine coracana subsp. coracana]|nr:hypothetical protein QOZ80_1BG0093160 [Eleusine coracana subsp. coracana]
MSSSIATLEARSTVHPGAGRCHALPRRARFATATKAAAAAATLSMAAAEARAVARLPKTTRSSTRVASMWREVQGRDDWAGLLQPLHPVVRDEVARYGELVDACYAAVDTDPSSARYMCSSSNKQQQPDGAVEGYEVTRYIYATPSTSGGRPSCVGYVAVSTDETTRRLGRRDVVVAFRGTVTRAEWAANLMSSLSPARLQHHVVKVESGFLDLYTSSPGKAKMGSCREQLLREVSRLVTSYSNSSSSSENGKEEEVSVTLAGHSMGSALALLFAYDLAELGLNSGAPVTVFSFGGPRVGNAAFKARCDELGVKALRVANVHDPVTKLPGVFLNERTPGGRRIGDCYTHVGEELALDFLNLRDLAGVHDLATYVASLRAEACCQQKQAGNNGAKDARGVLARGMEFAFTA